jgi:hypothetical protein
LTKRKKTRGISSELIQQISRVAAIAAAFALAIFILTTPELNGSRDELLMLVLTLILALVGVLPKKSGSQQPVTPSPDEFRAILNAALLEWQQPDKSESREQEEPLRQAEEKRKSNV